jgi:hypothetical protein
LAVSKPRKKFRPPGPVVSRHMDLCPSTGKRCYPDRVAAQVDNQHLPEAVKAYFCLDCSTWHITRGRESEQPTIYELLRDGRLTDG